MSGKAESRSFLKGATLIMLATVLAKVLGACYRIPLTNILGAEGMGVYQLIYPVYSLILTSSSGALPVAVSVLVASATSKGKTEEARKLVRSALAALLFAGIALAAALVLFSGLIGRLQGSEDTRWGYIAIAPSVFFVSGIAVFKGWFQGKANMLPTALSQITEAAVRLVAGLLLAYFLSGYGIAFSVAGALAGVSAAEGFTLLMLYIFYRKNNPPLALRLDYRKAKEEYKAILRISLPITVGSMIFPLTQFVDSFLVVNILSASVGTSAATASYGLLSGPVNTLINLPVTFALAVGVAVVPHLAKNRTEHDIDSIRLKLATAVKVSVAIGVPFAALFLAAPLEVLGFLYPALAPAELEEAGVLLRISALTVISLAVMQICVSVQQGLGDTRTPIINLAVGGAVKVVLDVALLFAIGIEGVAIASLLAFTTSATLNALSLTRLTGKNPDMLKNSGVILLCGVIICLPVPIAAVFGGSRALTLAVATVAGTIYLAALFVLPVFRKCELLSLPFGGKLAALSDKLKIKRAE